MVSAALSQLDSEEEWKLIPSGSGNSSGGKGGPYSPPEIAEMPAAIDEQRVIMTSGDKVSLHSGAFLCDGPSALYMYDFAANACVM